MSKTLFVFLLCFFSFQANALRMSHEGSAGASISHIESSRTIEVSSIPEAVDALGKTDKSHNPTHRSNYFLIQGIFFMIQ